MFTILLNKNTIKFYSCYTSLGAVFAERFIRTTRDLIKRAVFEKSDGNGIDVSPTKTNRMTVEYNSLLN